jgi:hypothetical protein
VALILIRLVSDRLDRMSFQCLNYVAGRILRYLATNHIFRELSPDIFANNRASSVLDTGKSVVALKAECVR